MVVCLSFSYAYTRVAARKAGMHRGWIGFDVIRTCLDSGSFSHAKTRTSGVLITATFFVSVFVFEREKAKERKKKHV